jgi:hypothetical protein
MRWTVPFLFVFACNNDKDSGVDDSGSVSAWRPDIVCPGDPQCATGEGPLEAGASAVSITPTCFEQWLDCGEDGICPDDPEWIFVEGEGEGDGEWDKQTEAFLDCGCDQLCEGDDGWEGADEGEADGEFQAMWLAGFQNGRPANGVHDDIWSRALVVRQGDTTVALVTLDVVGFFYSDLLDVRAEAAERGVDVDQIIVSSTHVHEAPDTLGQWGLQVGRRGVNEPWMAELKTKMVDSVENAVAALEPAELLVSAADVSQDVPEKGTRNQIHDKRDPRIVDEMMGVALLRNMSGTTIATIVNFGNHPEALADENTAITSDFAHYVRDGMENGVAWESGAIEGLGGVSLYVQASVGGMMTPLGVEVTDRDGQVHSQSNFDKAQAIGHMMASQALESLVGVSPDVEPELALRGMQVYFPIDNFAFQAMYLMGVFQRPAFNYDPDAPLDEYNVPELQSELDILDLGSIRMLTVPGELLPEIAVGGYDGSHTNIGDYTDPIVNLEQANAADLSLAPEGPYLKERMGGETNWIIGLGNDELGYIIPGYNYILHETVPYVQEAEGDHYEETNSLGPRTAAIFEELADQLIDWVP